MTDLILVFKEYLQNSKELVQCNNLSQSFIKIQCMHLKYWEKNRHFKGALAFFFSGSMFKYKQNKNVLLFAHDDSQSFK